MYSRQHRTGKNSANNSDIPATNQFAPRPYVHQSQPEAAPPQQDQAADLQAKSESKEPIDSGMIELGVLSRYATRPEPQRPRIQMKLNIDKLREKNEQKADIAKQINNSESLQREELPSTVENNIIQAKLTDNISPNTTTFNPQSQEDTSAKIDPELGKTPSTNEGKLYAQAAAIAVGGILIIFAAGAFVVYWQRTENDRQEVLRIIVDRVSDKVDSITNKIVTGLQQSFGSISELFREEVGNFVDNVWVAVQSGQQPTKPELAIPLPPKSKDKDDDPSLSHSPQQSDSPTLLTTENNRALTEAQIAYQKAEIEATNARTNAIKAEIEATNAQTNVIKGQTNATRQQTRLIEQQGQTEQSRWNQIWRAKLDQVPPDQQEAIITQASKEYFKYTGEKINVKNPNPSNVGLWSDTIGDIINRNQIYGQSASAITPAAPPPKLGGFGEGPQADIRNNTAYPRTEPLPPLGGFGEGPLPQIPSHTGHPPTVSGIPEQLEGFGAGPQADVSHVFTSNIDDHDLWAELDAINNPSTARQTPGGRILSEHAYNDSLVRHGLTPEQVDNIIDHYSRRTTQADGATVYIQVNRDKTSNIAIVNEQTADQIIVTAIKNLQPKELRRLGENNGFNPNP